MALQVSLILEGVLFPDAIIYYNYRVAKWAFISMDQAVGDVLAKYTAFLPREKATKELGPIYAASKEFLGYVPYGNYVEAGLNVSEFVWNSYLD